MKKILNLTQHIATHAQNEAGVDDLKPEARDRLKKMLTFETLPGIEIITDRARNIALLASGARDSGNRPYRAAMIGGAPYLMSHLEAHLEERRIVAGYAFSKREVIEDGPKKTAVFKHIGFVWL